MTFTYLCGKIAHWLKLSYQHTKCFVRRYCTATGNSTNMRVALFKKKKKMLNCINKLLLSAHDVKILIQNLCRLFSRLESVQSGSMSKLVDMRSTERCITPENP